MSKVTSTSFDLGGSSTGVNAKNDKGGMVFDLASVDENKGFEVIPKGIYPAVIDAFDFQESKNGNPMIAVTYSLTDPEYENRKIFDYMVLGGDGAQYGLAKLKKFLVRVCPEVELSAFNPQKFADEGTAIGRECRVELRIQTQKQGEYKGEKRNQVKDVLQPDNAGSFLG